MTAEMLPLLTETEGEGSRGTSKGSASASARACSACAASARSRAARPGHRGMPIRSDLDLLVLVRDELTEACRKTIG